MAETNSTSVKKNLTVDDVSAIERRLHQVLDSQRAIHRLSFIAMDDNGDGKDRESALLAISEMARSNIIGLDACTDRLTGGDAIKAGNFADEFTFE